MWQLALDISSFFSQIATTILAGIGTWIAYQTFLRIPVQEHESINIAKDTSTEKIEELGQIVIFQTQNQRTILTATSKGLECRLFDYRSGKVSGLQWIIHNEDIIKIIDTKNYHVSAGLKPKTGTLTIGSHYNWLYSKILFPNEELLEKEITNLLKLSVNNSSK